MGRADYRRKIGISVTVSHFIVLYDLARPTDKGIIKMHEERKNFKHSEQV